MKKNLAAAFLLSVFALTSLGAETLPPQPEKDDFLEAYRLALRSYGVNASYEELACLNGLPFTPLRSSETYCGPLIRRSSQVSRVYSVSAQTCSSAS